MKKIIAGIFFVLMAGLVSFRLYEEMTAESAGPERASAFGRAVLMVGTTEVKSRMFESNLEVLGELRPQASVDVMSRISGRLSEVRFERGDRVDEGQLLAVVDDEDLRQQIQRAEAAIRVSRAGVLRDRASLDTLEIQARRTRQLHEQELVSDQDLEDIEGRLRVAQAQTNLSETQVQEAEASLLELKSQQDQTRIHSPLTGFVGTRYLDPGALVNSNVPILSVIDISRVKTIVPVSEAVLRQIRVGLAADIQVDAYPGRNYSGRVTRISPFLNPETRSADVEIEIPNREELLKPGMFARVSLEVTVGEPSVSIPRSALLTRGERMGVFLLDAELTTRFHEIRIGRIQGDYVEVLDGLESGTQVVTSGAQKLNEGDKVKIG